MAERPLASYSGEEPFFFVSYGHDDAELVYPEMRWLQEAGFNLWYDEGIHVGSVWRKAIADALSDSAGMLFIATQASVESDNCLKELNFVLDEEKPVFVIQLDDTKLPSLLRLALSDRQMLNRLEFGEDEYRTRLVDALTTVAPPTPKSPTDEAESQEIVTTVPSIGVQILAAGDDEAAFWAEGLIDDLATLLGHRSFGISTTHDPNKDLAALGRELDVSYMLSGNVRRSGERYRVNMKLTTGGTGTQIWGQRYDESGDAIDASDAISRVAAIDASAAIMDDEQKRVRDADVERLDAWGLCIRAAALNMNTIKERDELVELLRRAVRRDLNFPMAHSMLGAFLCLSIMTLFSRKPDEDTAEALQHADRALSLAPANPLIMQGAVLPHRVFGNEALALDLAERANAAGGSDSMFGARFIGNNLFACLIQMGREDEAIELMLDSRPLPEQTLYAAYAAQGNWPDALTWAQRHATTRPNMYLAWVEVANAMAMLDRNDEATEVIQRVTAMVPTFKLSYYEKGTRISWRNREKVVESQLAGLRKLDMD
jgi:TolB-like protein